MSEPDRDLILKALERVIDPELKRPVTELDMVRDVEIDGGDVRVTIALTIAGCPLRDSFETQVADVLRDVPGVERVALGFDVMTAEERQALTTKLRGDLQERSKGISLDASTRVLAVWVRPSSEVVRAEMLKPARAIAATNATTTILRWVVRSAL